MLQPKKNIKKAIGTGKKVLEASAISKILSKIPGADEVYDVANIFQGLKEGDYQKIGANFIGALLPGVSGKAFEAVAEDWLPPTPEIEKRKMQFNLQSSPAERQEYFKKYGPGYLNNPDFIKDQNLAYGTGTQGIMKKGMNPRKKYAAGTAAITPNGIPSPAATLNDYQIMMAKAEEEAASNAWLPVVATVGSLAQSAIGLLKPGGNKFGGKVEDMTVSGDVKDTTDSAFQSPIAANGMNNVNADVEVEGGEMYETPQGESGEFQGPSHEQGGIPMEVNQDIPEGTKIYSDRLKVGKETLAERKANRERQIANLEKIASQPLVDSAVKNATKRKMEAIQKEEIADLQFQEQVNNMQQMADTVVAAFGTSMAGVQANPIGESMRYGMGTGADGVTEYENGTSEDGIDPITMQQIQTVIGSNPDGIWGRRDRRKARKFLKDKDQTGFPSWVKGGEGITKNQQDMEWALKDPDFQKDFRKVYFGESTEPLAEPLAQEETGVQTEGVVENPIDTLEPTQILETLGETTEKVNLPGTMFSRGIKRVGSNIGKKFKQFDDKGMIPGLGDLTGLFGNYLGATSGLQNAAEQRSTDVTHQNVFANAGKQSQNYLEKAIGNVEAMKSAAEMKATTGARSSKASAGSGAKSISQKRSMNWLYDQGLADSIASISANAAAQVAGIRDKQAGIALSADQLSGEGQFKANMANEAAKDAYYTARGLGLKDQSMAVQQTGKDLNAMKQNKIIENLMKQYGTYGQVDPSTGLVTNKPILGQTPPVYTLNGKKYTTDSSGNLKLI